MLTISALWIEPPEAYNGAVAPPTTGQIVVDFERRPLVVATMIGLPNEQQFIEYLNTMAVNMRYALARSEKTAVILDTTQAPVALSPRMRKLQAEWLQEHSHGLRVACVGMGFVIQSALVRGAMTAVLWLQGMPYPHAVCASWEKAEAYCLEQLAQHGQIVPPRARGR